MKIPYRGEEMDFRHLRVAGDLGQVNPVKLDPYDYDSILEAMEHCNVVINCVGNDFETGNWSYEATNRDLPEAIALAAAESGIERLVHMSAMGADESSSSALLRSKALGEAKVREAFPTATIMRPAPIVGTEDRYFNFFKRMSISLPGPFKNTFPLVDGDAVSHQPVIVQDVADAIYEAAQLGSTPDATKALGNTYELAGPTVYSSQELAELYWDSTRVMAQDRHFSEVPWPVLEMVTDTMQIRVPFLNPNPEIVTDKAHRLLQMDFVKNEGTLGLEELNLSPSPIEEQVDFLKVYWTGGQRGSGFLEM